MNQKQWIARQEELEREGKYDVDMNEEHRTFDALSIDEGYDYLLHTPIERVRRAIVLSVVAAVGPVITWFGLGARVKGRENLRALKGKGAICACTHTHHLDTLLTVERCVTRWGLSAPFIRGRITCSKKGSSAASSRAAAFSPSAPRSRICATCRWPWENW